MASKWIIDNLFSSHSFSLFCECERLLTYGGYATTYAWHASCSNSLNLITRNFLWEKGIKGSPNCLFHNVTINVSLASWRRYYLFVSSVSNLKSWNCAKSFQRESDSQVKSNTCYHFLMSFHYLCESLLNSLPIHSSFGKHTTSFYPPFKIV